MTDDLISRQAAIDLFPNDVLEWDTLDGYIAPHAARRLIEDLPSAQTVDAVPVRHGRWLRMPHKGTGFYMYQCSVCHDVTIGRQKYCPNCGALMNDQRSIT